MDHQDVPTLVKDWFPEGFTNNGLHRLSKAEAASDLDMIHANISRIDRKIRTEHEKPSRRLRLIEKLAHELYVY